MTELTDKQRRVFEFIQEKLLAGLAAPSIREISRRFGWSGGRSATDHLAALIRKSWLERDPRKGRALRLARQQPTRTSFALHVSDDSMIDRHILQGDIAMFQANAKPRSGQIVAALIDGKITLKTVVKKNGRTFLKAGNHPDLIPSRKAVIQGVLRAIMRRTIAGSRRRSVARTLRLRARQPVVWR